MHHPRGRTVLVIDDNRDGAETLSLLLCAIGYTAVFRTDPRAGIAIAKVWLPDVILLDIGMPVIDGFGVAVELRKVRELDDSKIIALTAWGDQATIARAAASGFDAHVAKPVSLARLRNELEA